MKQIQIINYAEGVAGITIYHNIGDNNWREANFNITPTETTDICVKDTNQLLIEARLYGLGCSEEELQKYLYRGGVLYNIERVNTT